MELRVLQYFLTVAREGNITRAADILHITQPTLSRQLQQLEQELGTELFVRGRNFTLTDSGVILRRRAEEVIDLLYKIESEIAAADDVAGIISIGSGALKSSHVLPELISGFKKLYPKVSFEIYSNSSQYTLKNGWTEGCLISAFCWSLLILRSTNICGCRAGNAGDFLCVPIIRWHKKAASAAAICWACR